MGKTALFALLLLTATAIPFPASETAAASPEQEPVHLTVANPAEAYPPFHYLDENGDLQGLMVDILNLLAPRLHLRLEYRNIPWKRALLFMSTGQADAMLCLYRTPEREEYILFPDEPFAQDESVFFTRKGTDIPWTGDLRDLKDLTIIAVEANSYGAAFDNADFLKKWEARDELEMLKMINGGRYPLGVAGKELVVDVARQLGILDEIVILTPPVTREGLYLGFSRAAGHEQLAEEFSSALRAFKETQLYEILLRKHGLQ